MRSLLFFCAIIGGGLCLAIAGLGFALRASQQAVVGQQAEIRRLFDRSNAQAASLTRIETQLQEVARRLDQPTPAPAPPQVSSKPHKAIVIPHRVRHGRDQGLTESMTRAANADTRNAIRRFEGITR